MIDMSTEELVLLKTAAKLFPNRPHLATLYRWADGVEVVSRRGKRAETAGQRTLVKLDTLVIGDERYTSKEAAQRFVEAYTVARDGEPTVRLGRTSRERQRDVSQAREQLARAGI
jgi:hypothetical protein